MSKKKPPNLAVLEFWLGISHAYLCSTAFGQD